MKALALLLAAVLTTFCGCALFEGQATQGGPEFDTICPDGVSRCARWEECSTGRPYKCIPRNTLVGTSRDAGSDR